LIKLYTYAIRHDICARVLDFGDGVREMTFKLTERRVDRCSDLTY